MPRAMTSPHRGLARILQHVREFGAGTKDHHTQSRAKFSANAQRVSNLTVYSRTPIITTIRVRVLEKTRQQHYTRL
jgi:hypothetical protein